MVKLTPDVQRPFVNVFTQFRVQEPSNSAIVGHAQSVLDKHIGKRVYRIIGSVPAANFISIPKLPSESLGLVGKNLYVQLHIDLKPFFSNVCIVQVRSAARRLVGPVCVPRFGEH